MVQRLTPAGFRESPGVEDWQVRFGAAVATFRTGSFAAGVRLVDEIGRLADAADHHPDVDLRYAEVRLRLWTHSVGGLTERDVALARQISAAARALDAPAPPPADAGAPAWLEPPREPPPAGDEVATLLGSLERQRRIVAWKCGGVDAAGMRATVGASTVTLGGLLYHLALVEEDYFSGRLGGRELGAPWDAVDWDADRDWEWRTAAEHEPAELLRIWRDAVARSRAAVAEALDAGGLDQPARRGWPDGRTPTLRRLLIDVIEEYARHAGHADLIRESVDGLVGEDP